MLKKTGIIAKVLFYLNLIAGVFLLLAYLAPYVSPEDFWPLAFFGLAFPYILLINLLFILIWGFMANSRFLFSLLLLIIGYKAIPNHFQLQIGVKKVPMESFKLLSFNVRVFDLYMWTEEKTTRNKIFEFLNEEDADVVCLQEFYHSTKLNPTYEFKTLDTLLKFLRAKDYHVDYSTTLRETDNWGIITFSSFPIINKGKLDFPIKNDNTCIFTDIVKGKDTIRIYNAHLASIQLNQHDYKVMQKMYNNDYSPELEEELVLLEKLKIGFKIRSLQAETIAKSIKSSPYPVVVCGDFNDTPSSYAYQIIRAKLKDAFVESGNGMGRTYNGEFPSFRIDYILHSPALEAFDFQVHPLKLSDHYPLSVYLK